jgi:predicted DsbA family dithiol-disulfide isomerase/uncharacterized membrane protein
MEAGKESQSRTSLVSLLGTGALLVPTLVALVASAVLLVDYVRPAPVFCEATSGCGVLKQTSFASFFGFPTPAFGLLAFTVIGVLALLRGATARAALLVIATAAGLVASWLLSVQFRFDVWCRYCVAADTSSLVVCAVALWRGLAKWDPPAALAPRGIAAALLVPAIAAPLVVGFRRPIVVPDIIARELSTTPAGEVTVIDFVDFECPFCRMTNAALSPILAAHRDHIHLVRKQVPLTRMHEHALDAARASCCGERLGKGDAMADALFSAPVDELTVDGCAKLAVSLGLDEAAFRSCTQDPAVDARIQADSADFKAAEGHGLPTLWVGQRKIEGAQPAEVLERAITKAIDGRS